VWLDEWKGEDRARALADCGVEPGT